MRSLPGAGWRRLGALAALALWLPAVALAGPSTAKRTEAAAISQVAAAKAAQGKFDLCAELYHQAYRVDPSFLGYLYSAGRCEQKGGKIDAAERDYRAFLARAPADDAVAARARAHLDAILEQRAKAPPPEPAQVTPPANDAPAPAVAPDPPRPAPVPAAATPPPAAIGAGAPVPTPADWKRPVGWACVGTGSALLVAGGAFAVLGWMDRADLQSRLDQRSEGLIVGMTPAEAHAAERDYRGRYALGGILGGVGALAVATGAWMWATAPQTSVGLQALPGGAAVRLSATWR